MTGLLLTLALGQTPVDLRLYKGQPPSAANAIPVSLGAGSSTIGKVDQGAPGTSTTPWFVKLTDGTTAVLVTVGGALKVDGSGGTFPVSGSVTANAGTNLNTSALALDATLTGGTAKGIVRGAAKGATTAADGTTTAEGADHQSVDVQIYSGGVAKDPTAIRALTSADVVTTAPPLNASTNLAQVAGATVATGNGTAAGVIRVSMASDSTGVLGATESGIWTVQPGNTPNSTPWLVTDSATSATGSAPPAKAIYVGLSESTNEIGAIQCDKVAQASAITTATDTQLIALSGSTLIYVCSYAIQILGVATTAGTLQLEYGTGTNCATGKTAITPTWAGNIDGTNKTVTSIAQGPGTGYLFKTTAGQALCALSTANANGMKVFVTYAQK